MGCDGTVASYDRRERAMAARTACVLILTAFLLLGAEAWGMAAKIALENRRAQGQGSTPSELAQAFEYVNEAIQLIKTAQSTVRESQDRQHLKTAIDLYTQAGQRFEYAETVFRSLEGQYVSSEDIDRCAAAKDDCIKAVKECAERLGSG